MQNKKRTPEPSSCEPAKYEYKKSSYAEIYEALQSLRKDEVFCDIKLETDDGGVIFGHKVVLASASPYFHAMFTHFAEKSRDLVVIKNLDSTTLHLLVDFIYSGEITITEKNVQDLLPASNFLQLKEVKETCCYFLQEQLCLTNCTSIYALADLHSCKELLTSSELFIQQHFSEIVDGDEFLSLSSEQMVMLIASDELTVPSEAKVFESVIRWVKHDLDSRKRILPQLIEHVRLPLLSKDYIIPKVVEEPLINNCLKCKDYVIEALHFHLLKSDNFITIPHNIRTKPRRLGGTHKVILVVGGLGSHNEILDSTEWYDPKINQWQSGPKMITPRYNGGLVVGNDNFVFYIGGFHSQSTQQSVDWLDFSSESPSWKPTTNMLVKRQYLGVCVINNYIYAVGGFNGLSYLNSAEVFNCRTQKWRMISSMSTERSGVGLGVLNNLLYAVGGYDGCPETRLKSVECYHPTLDKWTAVAEMCVGRSTMGVGVLDGVLYAVGGHNGFKTHKSVETYTPSTGIWTIIADMHLCRHGAGVAVLNGLLYVVGGKDGTSLLDSVEFYDPNTKMWTMVTASMKVPRLYPGVVAIDRQ